MMLCANATKSEFFATKSVSQASVMIKPVLLSAVVFAMITPNLLDDSVNISEDTERSTRSRIAVGILLTVLAEKWPEYVPSPAAIGIGMLITAAVLLTFILGGVAQLIWAKWSPETEKTYRIPLASGLICGEAIIAVVLAVLAALGVNF